MLKTITATIALAASLLLSTQALAVDTATSVASAAALEVCENWDTEVQADGSIVDMGLVHCG